MILIIGGAYQGKTRYARQHYPDSKLYYVQNLLKEAKQKQIDERSYIEQLVSEEPQAVFTLDDVGCGIVPLERNDRDYRELVGTVGCYLASQAKQVIRVSCGIGQVIKG